MAARCHQLSAIRLTGLVKLGVHEHDIEGLDAFNFEVARLIVKSPNASHHIIRACDESTAIVTPVNRAHISLQLHALCISVMLDVGKATLRLAEL